MPARKSTLALKSRADIIGSPKQENQWPHKKDWYPPNFFKKNWYSYNAQCTPKIKTDFSQRNINIKLEQDLVCTHFNEERGFCIDCLKMRQMTTEHFYRALHYQSALFCACALDWPPFSPDFWKQTTFSVARKFKWQFWPLRRLLSLRNTSGLCSIWWRSFLLRFQGLLYHLIMGKRNLLKAAWTFKISSSNGRTSSMWPNLITLV